MLEAPEAISFSSPITIIGAGAVRRKTLDLAQKLAPETVAVDAGADRLRSWGLTAAAVVGDMDSIEDLQYWRQAGSRILHAAEQDSTDLEKCLRLIDAPLYLAVGFLGSRFDHSFAAFGALGSEAGCRLILLGGEDIAFAPPQRWRGDLPEGARLSILALRPVRITGAGGLRWSPDGLVIGPETGRGIANTVTGQDLWIAFDQPGAILVVEREHLPAIVGSLC